MAVLTWTLLILTISLVVHGRQKHDHDHHDKHDKHLNPIFPDMARFSDPAYNQNKPAIPNFGEQYGPMSGFGQSTYSDSKWSSSPSLASRSGVDEDEPVGSINNPYHTEWKQESHSSYSYHSPQGDQSSSMSSSNRSPDVGKSQEHDGQDLQSNQKFNKQGIIKESDKLEDKTDNDKKRKTRDVSRERDSEAIIYPDEVNNEKSEAKIYENKQAPSQENDNELFINRSRDVDNFPNRNSGGTVIIPLKVVTSTIAPVLPNNQQSDWQGMMPNTQLPPNINQGMNIQKGTPINNVVPNTNGGFQKNVNINQPNGQTPYLGPQDSQTYPNNANSFQNQQNLPLNYGPATFPPENNQYQQSPQGQGGYDGTNVAFNNVNPALYAPNNNAYSQLDVNQNIQGIPGAYNNLNGNQGYVQNNPTNLGGQAIITPPNNMQGNGQLYNIIPLNNWPNTANQIIPQNPTGQYVLNPNGAYMPLSKVLMNGNQLPQNQGANLVYSNPNVQTVQPNQGNMYLIPQNNLPNNNLGQGYNVYMLPAPNNGNGANSYIGNGQGASPNGYQVPNSVPVYNMVPLTTNGNSNLAMTRDVEDENEV